MCCEKPPQFLPLANEVAEGNVFSRVCPSFCPQGGSHVTIAPNPGSHCTGTLPAPSPVPQDIRPGTHTTWTHDLPSPDIRPETPSSDIWWWPLETCSDLFIRGQWSDIWWWPLKLKHAQFLSRWFTSYWNAFCSVLDAIGLVNCSVNGCQKVTPQPIGFFHNSKPMVVAHLAKLAKLFQVAQLP